MLFDALTVALPDGGAEPVVTFDLEATAGDARDVLTRTSPVRPWGMEYADTRAGVARDNRTFELQLPPGQPYTDRRLTVQIGPTPERTLIDAAYSVETVTAAIIVCSIIPVLLIYPWVQKYFNKGILLGGVKE